MLVSFLMPVFDRPAKQPDLVGEAVYWFLRQTWPDKELVVLGHAKGHKIVCNAPGVRVYNWPTHIDSLGEKCNILTELARGDICLPCEDDDISLPWRAEQAVRMVKGYDCWFPMAWWYEEFGRPLLADGNGYGYTSGAYQRESMLGKHPHEITGHDMHAKGYMLKNLNVNEATIIDSKGIISKKDISFVYRWGVSAYHFSAQPNSHILYKSADPGPPGIYRVQPKMKKDYESLHFQASNNS